MPLTEETKHRFIAAYQDTGNMSQAMRMADIRSRRTAYRWWQRYCAEGAVGLQALSHAPTTPGRIAVQLGEAVREARLTHPQWGRRRIAEALNATASASVISPSSVARVLGQIASQMRPSRGPVGDVDAFLSTIAQGLQASSASQAADAARLLGAAGWDRIPPDVWPGMLRHPHIGRLLVRSRIQLGHSYMNTGAWAQAAYVLSETFAWMHEAETEVRLRQRETGATEFSLQWDDLWVEALQYLGIVLRAVDPKRSLAYLHLAHAGLQASGPRQRRPTHPDVLRGNVARDLAKAHLIQHRPDLRAVATLLGEAQQALAPTADIGMQGATWKELANLASAQAVAAQAAGEHGWGSSLDTMQAALGNARGIARQLDSPILQVNTDLTAIALHVRHGLPVAAHEVVTCASVCLRYGYGGQARQMLRLPALERWLPQQVLVALSHRFTQRPQGEAWL